MPRSIELSTLEIVVAKEALIRYHHKAEVKATEYEAETMKGEGKPYSVPLLHPRLIADSAQQVLDSLEQALTAEKKFNSSVNLGGNG